MDWITFLLRLLWIFERQLNLSSLTWQLSPDQVNKCMDNGTQQVLVVKILHKRNIWWTFEEHLIIIVVVVSVVLELWRTI